MATIYKILSPCLKECYVGSTTRVVETRWKEHRSESCRSQILFNQYGYDNCKFIVLEVCPLKERYEKEQWWIDHSVGLVNKNNAIFNNENKKAYCKEYYEANKENKKAYYKAYIEANKENKKAYRKAYYEANKEKHNEDMKRHYEANKEKILQRQKAHREAKKASPSAE